jgi:gas vesicle protein
MRKTHDKESRQHLETQTVNAAAETKYSAGTKNKLTYLLVGGGIGALVALLFAPKSGTELRTDITDAARKGVDKTRETAAQFGERSNEYLSSARQKAGDLYNRTGGALSAAKNEFGRKTSGAENEQVGNSLTAGDFNESQTTGGSFGEKDDLPIA